MTPFVKVKCTNKFLDTRQTLRLNEKGSGKKNLWVNDDNVVYFYRKFLIYGIILWGR